ncbi:MAG: hypothetical protein GY774_34460 [Planctomycetes bacterium]|nr:hypothetical protein [Planctomycetota bacterium]
MSKNLIYLASFVLVLGLTVDVQAAVLNWTGNGADDLWSTPENWSTGTVPTAGDKARIQAVPGARIVNEGAIALDSWVGAGQSGELTVDGGTLTTTSFIVVARQASGEGILNMVSGTITAGGNLYVGHTGVGTLNMTGGTITAPTIVIPHNGTGHVNLDGGILGAGALNMQQVADTTIVGTMDVGAGTLILNGNDLAVVQGYIDNSWITAYEGQGTLNLEYDDVADQTTLTALHNLNPFPADRGSVKPGAVELSWTLPDPCVPGEPVSVDVYFTDDLQALLMFTDPAAIQVVNQQNLSSVAVQTQAKTRYYWAVDTYIGDPNDPIFGSIFTFMVDNLPPQVDTGANAVTWLVDGVMTKNLDATVTDDEAYTVQWTVVSEPNDPNNPDAVIVDPSVEDTSITLAAYGEYVLQLEASDGEYTGSDTVTINVYSDGCEAAKSLPDYVGYPGDLNGDCIVDDLDLAILQEDWLKDSSLTEP